MLEKDEPCETRSFLSCSSDLLVDEEVEHGQQREGKDVHEDKVEPCHVYLNPFIVNFVKLLKNGGGWEHFALSTAKFGSHNPKWCNW